MPPRRAAGRSSTRAHRYPGFTAGQKFKSPTKRAFEGDLQGLIAAVIGAQPDHLWWRAVMPQQIDEVTVLGDHNRVDLAGCLKDLWINGIA